MRCGPRRLAGGSLGGCLSGGMRGAQGDAGTLVHALPAAPAIHAAGQVLGGKPALTVALERPCQHLEERRPPGEATASWTTDESPGPFARTRARLRLRGARSSPDTKCQSAASANRCRSSPSSASAQAPPYGCAGRRTSGPAGRSSEGIASAVVFNQLRSSARPATHSAAIDVLVVGMGRAADGPSWTECDLFRWATVKAEWLLPLPGAEVSGESDRGHPAYCSRSVVLSTLAGLGEV